MTEREKKIVKETLSKFLPIWLLIIIFIEMALINIHTFVIIFTITTMVGMWYLLAKGYDQPQHHPQKNPQERPGD